MTAFYVKPGAVAVTDANMPLTAAQLTRFNGSARPSHRVGVYDEPNPILLGAKLRHELEHVVQQEQHPDVLTLGELLMHALGDLYGGGGPASGCVYGAMPHERAANDYAARFVRAIFADDDVSHLQRDQQIGALLGLGNPEPRDGLGRRSLACAALNAQAVESQASELGLNLDALTRRAVPDVTDPWLLLRQDVALPAYARRLPQPVRRSSSLNTPRGPERFGNPCSTC
jgi:hypothetical protein